MEKRLNFWVGIAFLTIFLLPLASSFQLDNSSQIEESYSAGAFLRGLLNISFSNEPVNSKLASSGDFGGGISLINFLNNNSASYNCIPRDCSDRYLASNPEVSKSFSLNYGQEKIISFVLNGNIKSITNLSFDVSISNQQSCINPVKIDILNDNRIEFVSRKIGNNYECVVEGGKGCFNSSASLNEVYVSLNPYCEKISLPGSERFQLGAWVKKGTGNWQLQMVLYDLENNELKNCNLPEATISGGEISCSLNYSNKEIKEYYVCLKANGTSNDIIKTESSGKNCGFNAVPGDETEYYDYWIFARGARYEDTGILAVNQQEYEKEYEGSLSEYIADYVSSRYSNNCSSGCSIPVKFKAYQNLNLAISNLSLAYSTLQGQQVPGNKIYDAVKEQAKINSGFIALDLSYSNISVPKNYGNYTLTLYLNNTEIISKKIRVENTAIIKSLYPLIISAGIPVKFVVNVSVPAGRNISIYRWDFGDNSTNETNQNYVTHTYSKIESYSLNIEVEDNLGYKTSRIFTITAGNPKEIANSTIQKYKKNLNNISANLASLPLWYKSKLGEKINFDSLKDELNNLEQKYNSASSDEEYVEIMSNLSKLNVPNTVKESVSGEIPFFISQEEINLAYLKDFGAGDFDEAEEDKYKEAVAAWTQENLNLNLEFRYISAYYDDRMETLASIFNLKINPKESENKEFYAIVGSNNVVFNNEENTEEFEDATGVKFDDISERNLEFAVMENIPVNSLVLYLSPRFSQLEFQARAECNPNGKCEKEAGENWRNCREDCKPWGWVIILLIILFAFAIIAYIFLQWWYKYKYEGSLFKNRNDIYNIMNFISNAKRQGMNDEEITGKLKQAGWKGEQINYVFKKMQGKAIMPFDFLKLFKKEKFK